MDTSWCIPSVGRFQQDMMPPCVWYFWRLLKHVGKPPGSMNAPESWIYFSDVMGGGATLETAALHTVSHAHQTSLPQCQKHGTWGGTTSNWRIRVIDDGACWWKSCLLHTLVPTHPYTQIHPGWPACAISAQKWSEPVGGSYDPSWIIISHS